MKTMEHRVTADQAALEQFNQKDSSEYDERIRIGGEGLIALLQLTIRTKHGRLSPKCLTAATAALVWIIRPEFFGGKPLRQVADELGLKHTHICKLCRELEESTGFKSSRRSGSKF